MQQRPNNNILCCWGRLSFLVEFLFVERKRNTILAKTREVLKEKITDSM